MEIGLGVMQMRPDDFWAQTLPEWDARIAGYREANGASESEAFTAKDLAELEAQVDAEQSAQRTLD